MTVKLKLLDEADDALTVVAQIHSPAFINIILDLQPNVFFGLYRLDSDFCSAQLVLADHDRVGAALIDRALDLILLQLIVETLLVQYHSDSFLSEFTRLEE